MAKETLVAVGTIMTSKGKIRPGETVPSNLPAKDLKQLKALGLVEQPQSADTDDATVVDHADEAGQKFVTELQKQIDDLTSELATERERVAKFESGVLEMDSQITDLTVELDAEREKSAGLENEMIALHAIIDAKPGEGSEQTGLPLDGENTGASE